MGLLKHLLFWPVTGPLFLMDFSLGKVDGVVRDELTDDSRVKSALMELQLQLELGDIDDDEYVQREAALMRELREVREWRERFGMGVAGGPVRVQSSAAGLEVGAEAGAEGREESGAGAERGLETGEDRESHIAQPGEVTIELNLDEDG